jgi:hypothetical protein
MASRVKMPLDLPEFLPDGTLVGRAGEAFRREIRVRRPS